MIHTRDPGKPAMKLSRWLLAAVLLPLVLTSDVPAVAQSDHTGNEPVQAAQTAATTYLISFQGRLLTPGTGVPKPDAVYAMTFAIFDVSNGGAALWSESKNVLVSKGTFSTLLGDTTPLVMSNFNGQDLWLGVTVSPDVEATPRQRLTYTPYAFYSTSAGYAASTEYAAKADTLDGYDSSSFSFTGHNHMGETWAGSAPLTLSNADYTAALNASSNGPAVGAASTSSDGLQVSSAGDDGVQVTQANYGLYVVNTNYASILIGTAGTYGMSISKTTEDGVKIFTAGSPVGAAISSAANNGIEIENAQGNGVFVGHSDGDGVHVESGGYNGGYFKTEYSGGNGLVGIANNGTSAYGVLGGSTNGYAGYFSGKVHVAGTLTKSGGAFKIDHPLDPANKYLYHSFVESPDMKNIYDGVVTLDANGKATVQLPDWFEALNEDFRYQLTCIGGYAPVYIAEEVKNNQFKIAGGSTGLKVSWQVTGIRHDPYAEANRIVVEEPKAPEDQGRYLFPAGYGQSQSLAPAALLEKPMPQQPVIVNPAAEGSQSDGGKP